MLAKVKQWTKNATKSIAYSSFEYIKSTAPTTASFAESNQELYKDAFHAIRNRRTTLQRTRSYFDNNQYFKVGDSILKNAMSDLKSGNLYNKSREDKAQMEMMGFDDSFDLNDNISDTSDLEGNNEVSNDTGLIIKSTEETSIANANAVSNSVLTSAKYLGETQKTIANMQYAHHIETLHSMQIGFNSINTSLSNISKFNDEVVRTHAENSKIYFETSTRLLQEQNGMIKELLDMQREVYKSYQVKEKEELHRTRVGDIIDYNGSMNFREYGKNVKKNITNYGDELTGGMFSMLSDPATLSALAANPIGDYVMPYLISTILGPKTRVAFKNFDKTLSGAFTTAIARLNKAGGNWEGGLGQFLGKIFGIKNDLKTSIDTSKFEKGPMQWNGEANKALIEVIPGHLRKIESLLSGQPERLFDMKSGKWTTMKQVKKNYQSELDASVQSSMYDVVKEMASMKEALIMTKDARVEFEKNMANFVKSIYMNGGYYNPNDKDSRDRLSYNVSSQNDMDMLNRMYKNLRRGTKMQVAGSVMRSRDEYSKRMEEYERSGTSIYSNLYNESNPDKHLKINSKGDVTGNNASFMGSNLLETKDKSGKNVFDWLRNIHKELFTIKELGIGGNGQRSGRKGFNTSSSKNIDSKYNKLYGVPDSMNITRESSDYLYELDKAKREIDEAKKNGSLKAEYSQYIDEDKLAHAMAMVNAKTYKRDYNDRKHDISENTTWVREVFDEAISNESEVSKGKQPKTKKEGFLNQLVHAASIGDKWRVINEGISDLAKKPAALLTSTITKADEAIYDFFYGEESDIRDNYGHKIKGFFNVMVNKLNKSIDSMVKSFQDNIISPFLKKYHADTVWKASKNALKSMTGIDIDQITSSAKDYLVGKNGVIRPTINATKRNFKGAANEVIGDTKSVFGEAINGAKNLFGIGRHASGLRNVTKTGLNVLSEGEAVIPSWLNPWNPNRANANPSEDEANEGNILQILKSKGINGTKSFAKGTKDYKKSELIKDRLTNYKKYEKDYKQVGPKLADNFDTLFDNIKSGIAQLFGRDQDKVGLEIKQVNERVKKSIPDAVGKGLVGGTAGLLVGGPLLGAILGSSLSIVSGSEGIKDLLFGKKTLNKDTQEVTRNGGLVSKDVTDVVTRYLPSMKKYGIAGAVAGLVSPLGLVGGLATGATIGYIKENDTVRKLLFGDQDGLVNGKTKGYIKKFFPHMAMGTVGALALGPFGVLGSAVLGTASGLVTCSDEFKDAMLGPMDPRTKKRKGGVVGEIHEALIKPIADSARNTQERFFKYMKQDIFNPVKKTIMPLGKLLQIGMEKTFKGIGSTVKYLFTSKLGIPFFKRMEEMFAPIGWLGKAVNPAIKTVGNVISAPFKLTGKMGDYATRKLIEQGRADYISSSERLNFMNRYKKGKYSNYNLRGFDEALARTSGDNLKGVYGQLNRLKQGRGTLDKSEQEYTKKLGSTMSQYLKGTDLRRALQAAHSGDMDTVDSILDHYLPTENKQEIMEEINNQAAELRDIRARKEQYTGTESGAVGDINKTLGTKVDINNIDKYLSNIKRQISETEAKEAKHPETKVVTSIDTGMQALKQRLDTTNQLLSNILNGQSKLPNPVQNRLTKYNDRSIINKQRIGTKDNKKAESLNNDLRYRGYNKDTLNRINKFHFVDNQEHYEKIKELSQHSFIIPNLDVALSYNDKVFNRIIELAQAGYQITDYDKVMKYIQNDIQYDKILSLAKAGIRLSNLDIVANVKPENIQTAISLSELGYIDLDFLLNQDTQNDEWRYIDTNSPEAKARFNLQKSQTFKENYAKEGNSGLEKTGTAFTPHKQSKISKMNNAVKGKASDIKRHVGYDYNMTKFKINEAQGMQAKVKAATKGNLDPLSSLLINGTVAAGTKLGSKINSKDEEKTYINTEYGVETLQRTQDGSLKPDETKDNKEILDKIESRDNTQKGILSSLKELGASGLLKGKKIADKAKGKSGGLLGALKDLAMFIPNLFKSFFGSIGGLFGLPLKLLGLGGVGSKVAGWLGNKAKSLGGKALNWAGGKLGGLIGKTKIGSKILNSKIGKKLGGFFGGGGAGVDANGNSVDNPDDAAEAVNVSRDTTATYLQRIIDIISNGNTAASLAGNIPGGMNIPGGGKEEPGKPETKPGAKTPTTKAGKAAKFMNFGRKAGGSAMAVGGAFTILNNVMNGQETSARTYEETAAGAVTAVADSGVASTIIGKTKDALTSIATKIAKFIPNSAKNAMSSFFGNLLERVANPKNIAKIMEKTGIKEGFNAVETVIGGMTGGIGAAAMEAGAAITWFMIGFSNAAEMFKLSAGATATPGMKILAGITEAIDGLTPLGFIISSDDLLDLAVSYLGKYIGVTKADIDAANQKANDSNSTNNGSNNSGTGTGFFSKAEKAISDAGSSAYQKASGMATSAWGALKNTASSAWNGVSDFASNAWNGIKSVGSSVWDKVSGVANDVGNWVGDKYNAAKQWVSNKFSGNGKYGRGRFNSQLDPTNAMQFNTSGDTEYQDMADSGCGPVSATNMASALGVNLDPKQAAQYALNKGYKEKDGGTKPNFFTDYLGQYGIGTKKDSNQSDIKDDLANGNPVLLMGKDAKGTSSKNPFGQYNHYVVGTGLDENGNMIVQDPETNTPNLSYNTNDVLSKTSLAMSAGSGKWGRAKVKTSKYRKRMSGGNKWGRGDDGNDQNRQYVYTFLKAKGLSSNAIAGIMGNIEQESHFNPTDDNGSHRGICQWDYSDRWKKLSDNYNNPDSLESQTNFMWDEINERGLVEGLNATTSPKEAADLFESKFEVSGGDSLDKRENYADQMFNSIGNGESFKGFATSDTSKSKSKNASKTTKKKDYTGVFGKISEITDTLSNALSFGGSGSGKYGRSKYGKGWFQDWANRVNPWSDLHKSTDTKNKATLDAADKLDTQYGNMTNDTTDSTSPGSTMEDSASKAKYLADKSNPNNPQNKTKNQPGQYDSLFNRLLATSKSMASKVSGPLAALAKSLGSTAASLFNKNGEDNLTAIFGSNPFTNALTDKKETTPNETTKNNGTFKSSSTSADIQRASSWAQGSVGTSYGLNGCTAFVRDYLLQANNELGQQMASTNTDLMRVPNLVEYARKNNAWKDSSYAPAEGDIIVTDNSGHVIISDGQGGAWGDSSRNGYQIVHYPNAADAFPQIDGIIPTGASGASGKYGRGKFGRNKLSLKNLPKTSIISTNRVNKIGSGKGKISIPSTKVLNKFGKGKFGKAKDLPSIDLGNLENNIEGRIIDPNSIQQNYSSNANTVPQSIIPATTAQTIDYTPQLNKIISLLSTIVNAISGSQPQPATNNTTLNKGQEQLNAFSAINNGSGQGLGDIFAGKDMNSIVAAMNSIATK